MLFLLAGLYSFDFYEVSQERYPSWLFYPSGVDTPFVSFFWSSRFGMEQEFSLSYFNIFDELATGFSGDVLYSGPVPVFPYLEEGDTATGEPVMTFSDVALLLTLNFSYPFTDELRGGINLKIYREGAFGYTGSGAGIDLGIGYRFVHISMRDVFRTRIVWGDHVDVIERAYGILFSPSFSFGENTLIPSLSIEKKYGFFYLFSLEYIYHRIFGVNLSVSGYGFSFGGALHLKSLSLSYLYTSLDAGGIHKIELKWKMGGEYEP
ncbi:hypothetical protein DRQ18_03795 [bacterium]|nr:MAG: hypothetical protein DRQ18_03795 [bacterium]